MQMSPNQPISNVNKHKLLVIAILLVLFLALAAFWQVLPVQDWIQSEKLLTWKVFLRTSPMGPFLTIGAYIIGGLVVFPVFILIPVTGLIFGPKLGSFYSLIGLLSNASLLFAIGKILGQGVVRQLAGKRMQQLTRRLKTYGFLSIVTLRLLPLAPYTIINLVAGASPIHFRGYVVGTLIGIAPAVMIMTLLGDQIGRTIRSAAYENLLIMLMLTILLLLAVFSLKRVFDFAFTRKPDRSC
jgi:uncharacterized membrane protein YdjX (TVP38/TMEM64 family)